MSIGSIRAWIVSVLTPIRRSRLGADLDVFERELVRRAGPWRACSDHSEPWAREACEHLERARAAFGLFRLEEAWAQLNAARRASALGYETDELRHEATALAREAADKSTGWRGQTIEDLMDEIRVLVPGPARRRGRGRPSARDLEDARRALAKALEVRDEDLRNGYRRIALLRRRLAILMAYLLGAVAAVLALQAWWPIPLDLEPGQGGVRVWLHVIAWGVLGGSFTAILSVIGGSLQARVPEQLREGVITGIRPLFGVAGALAAYVLVRAGSFGIEVTTNVGLLAIAFAAGFSEALIVRAMGLAERTGSKEE
ncbi:MAG: hypothetical protein ACRDI0_05510 [Actinomycetota bacterium]